LQNKITESGAVIEANNLPVISGYKEMLETLFTNLISNALKFQAMGNQPHISITSRNVQADDLPAGLKSKKPMTLVSFTDNGIGFDQANVNRIFIMFEKLHSKNDYPGSGVGLAIVKKIMEAHDGFIQATAQPGKGATIQCYFPVE
jgi:signal transduction histidine kinase